MLKTIDWERSPKRTGSLCQLPKAMVPQSEPTVLQNKNDELIFFLIMVHICHHQAHRVALTAHCNKVESFSPRQFILNLFVYSYIYNPSRTELVCRDRSDGEAKESSREAYRPYRRDKSSCESTMVCMYTLRKNNFMRNHTYKQARNGRCHTNT